MVCDFYYIEYPSRTFLHAARRNAPTWARSIVSQTTGQHRPDRRGMGASPMGAIECAAGRGTSDWTFRSATVKSTRDASTESVLTASCPNLKPTTRCAAGEFRYKGRDDRLDWLSHLKPYFLGI